MKKHQSGYLNADIYEIRYIKNSIRQKAPPSRGAVSRRLTERLSQIYIKKSNRKFSLRFEKEEMGSEEKRLRE